MKLHKVSYIVPSDKRLDLEKAVEELFEGLEGFRHYGSFTYDPDKPQFFSKAKAKPTNGAVQQKPPKVDVKDKILALMLREPRPFSGTELCQLFGVARSTVSTACTHLVQESKIRTIGRGLYVATHQS